jgi:hypothetical protein
MAHVGIKTDWTLLLTTEEFRLVLKALGGRLKEEDLEEAKALGDSLSKLKGTAVDQAMKFNNKLLENLETTPKK